MRREFSGRFGFNDECCGWMGFLGWRVRQWWGVGNVPCAVRWSMNPSRLKVRITIIPTSLTTSGPSPWEATSGPGIISRSSAGGATGSRLPGIWEGSHGGRDIIAGVWLTGGAIPGRSGFLTRTWREREYRKVIVIFQMLRFSHIFPDEAKTMRILCGEIKGSFSNITSIPACPDGRIL